MFKKNEVKKVTEKVDLPAKSVQTESQEQKSKEVEGEKKAKASKQLSQKDSVYLAVCKIIDEHRLKLEEKPIIKKLVSQEQLEQIHSLVCDDLTSKRCRLKDTESNQKKLSNPAELKKYVKGMVQNWFRRDDRLNGAKPFK